MEDSSNLHIVPVQTPYQVLLYRKISGIYYYGKKRNGCKRGRHCYYSCDTMGFKIPLHPYTTINRANGGQCTAFYHNPVTCDVWLASAETGEPWILHDNHLPTHVLYNQIYSGITFHGHIRK